MRRRTNRFRKYRSCRINSRTGVLSFFVQRRKLLLMMMVFLLLGIRLFFLAEHIMGENLKNTVEITIREYVEQVLIQAENHVLREMSQEYGDAGETAPVAAAQGNSVGLLFPQKDAEGRIAMLSLNTDAVNRIGNEFSKELNSDIHDGNAQQLEVSIGTLLGSRLLSQITPGVVFDLMPVSVSQVTYKTNFDSSGINQVKYQVYLVVSTEARVKAPFFVENITVKDKFLAAEAVIVGEVPDTYADVTQDGLSDFLG